MFRTHWHQMGHPCQPISGNRNCTFISIHVLNNIHSQKPSQMRHILSSYHWVWYLRLVKCLFVISSFSLRAKKKKRNIPSVIQIANVNSFFFLLLFNVIEPQILVISSMRASGFIVLCCQLKF